MLYVDTSLIADPHINLAVEEHLLRNASTGEDLFLVYVNEPSVIIGRNQNVFEEVNREFVVAQGIHVVRRLTGGGAVYHDHGNLNFSYIVQNLKENVNNFRKFTTPVIRVLQALGVEAELGGRSDILVNGLKVSGNAQFVASMRMISHGTLLFDSNLERVREALRVETEVVQSKAVQSVRSQVANVSDFLAQPMNIKEFTERLLEVLFEGSPFIQEYHLNAQDWREIEKIAKERYHTWDWTYGRSPAFTIRKRLRLSGDELEARLNIKHGVISGVEFSSGLSPDSVHALRDRLVGAKYFRQTIEQELNGFELPAFFKGISLDDFINWIY
jgi:lipoate---protein ligase